MLLNYYFMLRIHIFRTLGELRHSSINDRSFKCKSLKYPMSSEERTFILRTTFYYSDAASAAQTVYNINRTLKEIAKRVGAINLAKKIIESILPAINANVP